MPSPRGGTLFSANDEERELTRARLATLVLALELGASGDVGLVDELYTDDVHGSSPWFAVASRDELVQEYADRADAFADVDLVIDAVDVVGERGYAEWVVSATPVEPSRLGTHGERRRRITMRGATVVHFAGTRIDSFHQYWDASASRGIWP